MERIEVSRLHGLQSGTPSNTAPEAFRLFSTAKCESIMPSNVISPHCGPNIHHISRRYPSFRQLLLLRHSSIMVRLCTFQSKRRQSHLEGLCHDARSHWLLPAGSRILHRHLSQKTMDEFTGKDQQFHPNRFQGSYIKAPLNDKMETTFGAAVFCDLFFAFDLLRLG